MQKSTTKSLTTTVTRRAWLTSVVIVGLATLLTQNVWAKDGDVRLSTKLSGAAIQGVVPSGGADFRARGTERRFSVEVEDVKLAAGTVLAVLVQGTEVGAVALDGLGFADLNLDSRLDPVPNILPGSLVVVTVKATGQQILSGVL
jgi:hypothetical protein